MSKILNLSRQTPPGSLSDSTGQQAVAADGSATLIASIGVEGVGDLSLNFFVQSGAITDVIIATAAAVPSLQPGYSVSGQSVNRLVASAGDFAVISDFLPNATAQPHKTVAGGSGYSDFDLRGRFARLDVYAKSTTANTMMTIDATSVAVDVG